MIAQLVAIKPTEEECVYPPSRAQISDPLAATDMERPADSWGDV
jgi:hypothetical protein